MKNYRILDAVWETAEHECALLTAIEEEDGNERRFTYAARQSDEAPLNQLLWNKITTDESVVIEESLLTKVLQMTLPVPDGYVLINGQLVSVEDEKTRVRAAVNRHLDELYSGRAMAMAERNPEYAENRNRQIDFLLNVENQPGFPFYIDWSVLEEE